MNLSCLYCFRRAKIQNLSAIHNPPGIKLKTSTIVSDVQRYKICQQFTTWIAAWILEKKIVSDVQRYKICQQFTTRALFEITIWILFQTCKDTKFESNSQHFVAPLVLYCIVSDVQRYKIWEQFTTAVFNQLNKNRLRWRRCTTTSLWCRRSWGLNLSQAIKFYVWIAASTITLLALVL